ncbi:MAG: hypothetical protein EZS28_030338 [Streblomastix strix]|uniref:Uncharacterized protein n=1 Tax=Streblomastix strix TaxID=222440 RepID=A0A5J4UU36_9EUKA|nr:MAG: hypothetical protein EZS28_030338 [Streblomastix strix]
MENNLTVNTVNSGNNTIQYTRPYGNLSKLTVNHLIMRKISEPDLHKMIKVPTDNNPIKPNTTNSERSYQNINSLSSNYDNSYPNMSQRTQNHITMLMNSNPGLQIEPPAYPDYYKPPQNTDQRSFQQPNTEERMNFSNYARLSQRPVYGEYKPGPQQPAKPQQIQLEVKPVRYLSDRITKPREDYPKSKATFEYTDQIEKYQTNQRIFPGKNSWGQTQGRSFATNTGDQIVSNTNSPCILRNYDGQQGLMDFGVKRGRVFVYGDPDWYLHRK